MVVIGITTTEQVYPHLPDFKYNLSIVIDTLIEDDINGEQLSKIQSIILNKLYPYFMKEKSLSQIFGEIPVVGMIFNRKDKSIFNSSSRIELDIDLYSSFNSI